MPMQTIVANLDNRSLKKKKLKGRDYYVAPVVLMTHAVHEGSKGPLYYPDTELEKWTPSWNHKPITNGHPMKGGVAVSASDSDIMEELELGFLLNSKWDGKQRSSAWIDIENARIKFPRFLEKMEKKEPIEVSTGLMVDEVEGEGEYEGKKFRAIAKNHRPDHLAILMDSIGACSIKDGGGLFQLNEAGIETLMNHEKSLEKGLLCALINTGHFKDLAQNKLSHSAIRSALGSEMNERGAWEGWIEDVFDKYFVFFEGGELFKQHYKAKESGVELVDQPEKVERVVSYKSVDDPVIGNADPNSEDNVMAKKDLVDKLIANKATKWEDKDREKLMKLEDDVLTNMEPISSDPVNTPVPLANQAEIDAATKRGAGTPTPDPTPVVNKDGKEGKETPAPPKQMSAKEWMDAAPAEARSMIQNSMKVYNQQKDRLIKAILTNEKAKLHYNEEKLKKMEVEELEGIAALAMPDRTDADNIADFFGAGAPTANAAGSVNINNKEGDLDLPVYDFEEHKKSA